MESSRIFLSSNFSSLVLLMQERHEEHTRNCIDPDCRCRETIEVRGDDTEVQLKYSKDEYIPPVMNRAERRAQKANRRKHAP